jgi:hypothetical protein
VVTEVEADAMSIDTRDTGRHTGSMRAGTLTVVLGVLAAAATAFTYVLSLSEAVNPPNWVRVLGLVWLPIGFLGTPITYTLARTGPGRDRGRVGLAIALAGLLAFVALLFVAG